MNTTINKYSSYEQAIASVPRRSKYTSKKDSEVKTSPLQRQRNLPPRSAFSAQKTRAKNQKHANFDKKMARLDVPRNDEHDNLIRDRIDKMMPQAIKLSFADYLWVSMKKRFRFSSDQDMANFVQKLYEDILFYIVDLTESFDPRHIWLATQRFVKYRYGLVYCEATLQDLSAKFVSFYRMLLGVLPQGDSPFMLLRSLLNNFDEVRNAPIFKKLYKFIMYVLCTSVLEQFGASKLFCEKLFEKLHIDATVKRKFHFGLDFFHCVLDTLIYVCEIGYQCFTMGSFEPIYHCGNKYNDWFDKAYELKRKSLLTGNCEDHGFTMFEFLSDVDAVIEHGESIAKYATHVGDFEKNSIKSLLNDVKMLRDAELTKKFAAQSRPAPFAVLLHGGSSVGKSCFSDLMFTMYAKVHSMPEGDEYIYTRNPNDKYWSGFRTSQWGIRLDDIGFLRPEKANNGDPSLLEAIQVINSVQFAPAQAELADKGKTPVKSRCVVATSNAADLNAFHYFSCSLAVRRRLPWVVSISPKAEYAKDNTMLDPSKVPELRTGEFPNIWNILVRKVVPKGTDLDHQMAALVEYKKFTDINEYLAWYATESIEFHRLQKMALKVSDKVRNVTLCQKCYYIGHLCKCVEIDSGVTSVSPQSTDLTVYEESPWVKDTIANICKQNNTTLEESVLETLDLKDKIVLYCYFNLTSNFVFWMWLAISSVIIYAPIFFAFLPMIVVLTYLSRPGSDYVYGRHKMLMFITSKAFLPTGQYYWRKLLSYSGDVLQSKFSQAVLASCALITTATLICSVSAMFTHSPKYEAQSVDEINPGVSPKDEDEETFNPWYKESFALTSFDTSFTTRSYKGLPCEKVLNMLKHNCVYFRIKGFRSQRAFCIGGHFYLVNSHGIPNGDFYLNILENTDSDGVTPNLKNVLVTANMVSRIEEKDIAIVYVRNIPPRRDFRELFAKESLEGKWKGCYIGRNQNGVYTQMVVDNIHLEKNVKNEYLQTRADSWVGSVTKDTVDGDCGYLLVTFTPVGPILLGIHYLGGMESGLAISVKVSTEDIAKLITKFKAVVVQSAMPEISAKGFPRRLGPLHKKSVFRYLENGTARVYGSFEGFKPRLSSTVSSTLMNPSMKARGYVEKYGKPVVRGYRPWRIAALDLTTPVTAMRQDVIESCVENFSRDILSRISKEELDKIVVYDYFTAVNGAAKIKFVDKLNRNTSMGCPWKKTKKHFITKIPPVGELLDPVEFDSDIMDRVKLIESQYRMGYRVCPVFCGNLKDEAVSFAKIEAAKTRVFCGAPVDWSIVVRKYLLSFIRVVQRNSFIFESAPGTNPMSLQWERIYRYLCRYGDNRIIAGDYKAFDKRMGAILILSAYDVIRNVCKAAGYSTEDLLVLSCIAEDTAFSFVDYDGDLVEFYGSNPSGHPLTVIINGLVNSIYMRYCYSVLSPDRTSCDFKRHVNLMTYGDDNVMGVSKDISFFSHTKIVDTLATFGVVYTMPDKESESVPFVHISEVDFLKRKFVYNDEVGAILAPLEEDSIVKSLMTCTVSKSVSLEHQCESIIGSAVREYFNYGRETFSSKSEMLRSIVEECNLSAYMRDSTFPSFEQLKEEFWLASKGIDVDKLRAQGLALCARCDKEDCDYVYRNDDDTFLICTGCEHCVDFGEDPECPRCGCEIFRDF